MVPSLSKLCVSNVHRIESRILETNLALSLKARDDSYACANYLREAYKEHIPPSPPRKKPNQPTNQSAKNIKLESVNPTHLFFKGHLVLLVIA